MKLMLSITVALLVQNGFAQGYSIDAGKFSAGSGAAGGGSYSISGTLGHAQTPTMSGGVYSLNSGFWSLISAVQSPGAPYLFLTRSGSAVTLYWQNTGNWRLEQNGNLLVVSGWTSSAGVNLSNGTNYLTVNEPIGNLFFRLKQ